MQGEGVSPSHWLRGGPLFPFMAPTLIFKRRRGSGRIEPGREVERPLSSSQRGEWLMSALRGRLLFPSLASISSSGTSAISSLSPCFWSPLSLQGFLLLPCHCDSLIFTKLWYCAALINLANTPVLLKKKVPNLYLSCFLKSRTQWSRDEPKMYLQNN